MFDVTGRVAIVTGAASGQGAAAAALLAAHGAIVVLTDLNERDGAAASARIGGDALFVRHDVASEKDWTAVVETTMARFGRLDMLVNNAGIFKGGSLQETDSTLWDAVYRVNQLSVFLGMRAVFEPMKRAGKGSIVNISSRAGQGKPPGVFAYASSKWAVRGMTQVASIDYAPFGIRVNAIFPGIIDTPMLGANTPAQLELYKSTIPLKRMGTVDEVARLTLFLASDASSYMTGAEIAIDGGF